MISLEIAAARELVDHWEVKMWRLSVIHGKNLDTGALLPGIPYQEF